MSSQDGAINDRLRFIVGVVKMITSAEINIEEVEFRQCIA
jgi:hypothetical protein